MCPASVVRTWVPTTGLPSCLELPSGLPGSTGAAGGRAASPDLALALVANAAFRMHLVEPLELKYRRFSCRRFRITNSTSAHLMPEKQTHSQ